MVLPICKSLCSSLLRRSWPLYCNHGCSFFSTSNQLTQGTSVFDYLVNHHLPFSPVIAKKASYRAPSDYRVEHRNADSVLSYLNEFGFSRAQIETIVQRSPLILAYDADKVLKANLEFFSNSGFEIEATRKIVTRDPSIILRRRIALQIKELESIVGSVANVSALLQRSSCLLGPYTMNKS